MTVAFNNNEGPSCWDDSTYRECHNELRKPAGFARKAHAAGCGPLIVPGPAQTWHRGELPEEFARKHERHIGGLHSIAVELGVFFALEGLNEVEDKICDVFRVLIDIAIKYSNFLLHLDIGHLFARGFPATSIRSIAHLIGLFEIANKGRWPLKFNKGMDVRSYLNTMWYLPDNCLVSHETFDQEIINAFDLKGLCDTTYSGPETVRLNIEFLKGTWMNPVIGATS